MISAETQFRDLTDLDHGSSQHIFAEPKFAKIARDSIHQSNHDCRTRAVGSSESRISLTLMTTASFSRACLTRTLRIAIGVVAELG